jgi:hypothetical protein
MKIKDLIKQLQDYPEDMEVAIEQPAHDYWHNTRATKIRSLSEEQCPWSEYHRSYIVSSDIDSDSKTKDYLVLS